MELQSSAELMISFARKKDKLSDPRLRILVLQQGAGTGGGGEVELLSSEPADILNL